MAAAFVLLAIAQTIASAMQLKVRQINSSEESVGS